MLTSALSNFQRGFLPAETQPDGWRLLINGDLPATAVVEGTVRQVYGPAVKGQIVTDQGSRGQLEDGRFISCEEKPEPPPPRAIGGTASEHCQPGPRSDALMCQSVTDFPRSPLAPSSPHRFFWRRCSPVHARSPTRPHTSQLQLLQQFVGYGRCLY